MVFITLGMITISLKNNYLTKEEEIWLLKNVGPRLHYLHNSIGGQGWVVRKNFKPGMVSEYWQLTLEDDRYATLFTLMFS